MEGKRTASSHRALLRVPIPHHLRWASSAWQTQCCRPQFGCGELLHWGSGGFHSPPGPWWQTLSYPCSHLGELGYIQSELQPNHRGRCRHAPALPAFAPALARGRKLASTSTQHMSTLAGHLVVSALETPFTPGYVTFCTTSAVRSKCPLPGTSPALLHLFWLKLYSALLL